MGRPGRTQSPGDRWLEAPAGDCHYRVYCGYGFYKVYSVYCGYNVYFSVYLQKTHYLECRLCLLCLQCTFSKGDKLARPTATISATPSPPPVAGRGGLGEGGAAAIVQCVVLVNVVLAVVPEEVDVVLDLMEVVAVPDGISPLQDIDVSRVDRALEVLGQNLQFCVCCKTPVLLY